MAINVPFAPSATTQSITMSAASQSITLSASGTAANSIRLFNSGTAITFVRWGTGAQTAVATDLALAPGAVELFTKGTGVDTLAAIGSVGPVLYVTCGEGF